MRCEHEQDGLMHKKQYKIEFEVPGASSQTNSKLRMPLPKREGRWKDISHVIDLRSEAKQYTYRNIGAQKSRIRFGGVLLGFSLVKSSHCHVISYVWMAPLLAFSSSSLRKHLLHLLLNTSQSFSVSSLIYKCVGTILTVKGF